MIQCTKIMHFAKTNNYSIIVNCAAGINRSCSAIVSFAISVGIPVETIVDYIKKRKPYILSSPSRSNSSRIGKDAWVRVNLKSDYKSLLLYPRHEKQNFSGENHILIDDMENTITEWNAKGGIGIHHTSTANTIKQLKELGL